MSVEVSVQSEDKSLSSFHSKTHSGSPTWHALSTLASIKVPPSDSARDTPEGTSSSILGLDFVGSGSRVYIDWTLRACL